MFTVTPLAAQQILAASQQHGIAEPNLRIAARRSMDGSIEYGLGFDDLSEEDTQIDTEGLKLLINPSSEPLLKGATLDYVELSPGEFQFIFINPNDIAPPRSGGGCGSGSSSGGGCGSGGCGSGGGCS